MRVREWSLALLVVWLGGVGTVAAQAERPAVQFALPPVPPPQTYFATQAEWRGYMEARISLLARWEAALREAGRVENFRLKYGLSVGAIVAGAIVFAVGVVMAEGEHPDRPNTATLLVGGSMLVATGVGCLILLPRRQRYREQIAELRRERGALRKQLQQDYRRPTYSGSRREREPSWFAQRADLRVGLTGAAFSLRF